jgi:hypothetical protein
VCHHCKRKGHIRPFCFKLYGYPDQSGRKYQGSKKKSEKILTPKRNNRVLMVQTFMRTSVSDIWYFDSGCSRHMTGEKLFLKNISSSNLENVVYGDGRRGRIQGIGNMGSDDLPKLENVFLVK